MSVLPVRAVRLTSTGLRRLADQMDAIAEHGVEAAEVYVEPDDDTQEPFYDGGKKVATWLGAFSISDDETSGREPDVLVVALVCDLTDVGGDDERVET